MKQETLDAMTEAAKESVHLDELQVAASKIIAEKTHAEAGIVTCGAAAALTLGTAACITGFDVARMNRLPDTTGMPNEVITGPSLRCYIPTVNAQPLAGSAYPCPSGSAFPARD